MSKYIKERSSLAKVELYDVTPMAADVYLDANESAYSMPPNVKNKVMQKLQELDFNRYPEMNASSLKKTIADSLNVKPENVQVGNGSSELLQVCCYAFGGLGKKIAFPYPSFSMYKTYADLSDSIATPFLLDRDFKVDVESLLVFLQTEQPDILILCNPNNPTGTLNRRKELLSVLDNTDCLVFADEAYMEFADESLLDYLDRYDNLIIFRTFSKAYGLASMRAGYLVCKNEAIMSTINKVLLPYHLNKASLAVAQVVWENKEEYQDIINKVVSQRETLSKELSQLGFTVYPSSANFILCNLDNSNEKSEELYQFLISNKILVRNFSKHPLLNGSLRITVGTQEENKLLLEKIKEYLK